MIYLIEGLLAVFAVNAYDNAKRRTPEQRATNRHFFKWVGAPVLILLLIGMIQNAMGAERTEFKNANGQSTGWATTNSAGTTYSDAMGRNVGRSTTSNGTTTFYDNMGRRTGSAKR